MIEPAEPACRAAPRRAARCRYRAGRLQPARRPERQQTYIHPTPAPTPTPTPTSDPTGATSTSRTLLAYFSRAGENYYYGGRRDLEVGNTEVLARMINELIDCRRAPDRGRRPVPGRVRRHRATQRARAGRRRAAGDRESARLDQPVRHRAGRQPDLERPSPDDHEHVRGGPRLRRLDRFIPSSPMPSAVSAAPKTCTPPPSPVPGSAVVWPSRAKKSPTDAATCGRGSAVRA